MAAGYPGAPLARDLTSRIEAPRAAIEPNGMIWVSWPKKSSRVPTDVTEDVVRQVALAHRLVDVKVCGRRDVVWVEAGDPAEGAWFLNVNALSVLPQRLGRFYAKRPQRRTDAGEPHTTAAPERSPRAPTPTWTNGRRKISANDARGVRLQGHADADLPRPSAHR